MKTHENKRKCTEMFENPLKSENQQKCMKTHENKRECTKMFENKHI